MIDSAPVPITDAAPVGRRKKVRRNLTFDRISFFVVFLGLPLAIFLLFVVWPFVQAFYYSLTDWSGFTSDMSFIGLRNYRTLLHDDIFMTAFWNNILLAIVVPLVTVVLSFVLATMVTVGGTTHGAARGIRNSNFYRVISFFPYTIPAIIIGILWSQMFDPSAGLLNGILTKLGLRVDGAWFCSDVCDPIIGNMVVYQNQYHITAAYSRYLSGVVAAQQSDAIWFMFYQPLGLMTFLISGIAENNRAPFDLPEAESELVAGFHTEYSGMRWSLFFMAEYAAMVVVSAVATTLYLGGWYFPFVYRLTEANGYHTLYVIISLLVFLGKVTVLLYLYFWLRWTLPRFRYDQLMDIGWKWLIPTSLVNIVLTAIGVFTVQALDGWKGLKTIDAISPGLDLTGTGKAIMIGFGILGIFITAGILSTINWRSRDFNLKKQRRDIRLVNLPKGRPAVAPAAND